MRCTAVTTVWARRSETSGTFRRMIASSSSAGGKSMKRCRHRRFEAVGQLARVVRGEDDQRDLRGPDRAELGHRAPGSRTGLRGGTPRTPAPPCRSRPPAAPTGSTDSIACSSGRGARKRWEKKASSWPEMRATASGSDGASAISSPISLLQELGVEELLGVLPLVERLALVEPLVALQADEMPPGRPRPASWPAPSCPRPPAPR